MVLGVMEEGQEDKKLGRWRKSNDRSLTHVPLGPVFSDMASEGWCCFLGRNGKQRRVSFGYRLRDGDER